MALTSAGGHDTIRALALSAVSRSDSGVMLFGSAARGDLTPQSDIDVLELTPRRSHPYRVERVNVSVYDRDTLRGLATRGSLFVLHLRREGQVLRDPQGALEECLAAYRRPESYKPYIEALSSLMGLLDTSRDEYVPRWEAFHHIALFVVRSVLYARLAEQGDPAFAMSVLKERFSSPDCLTALGLKSLRGPDWQQFLEARHFAEELLGTRAVNPFGSIEALVTNRAGESPLMAAFGLRLLAEDGFELTYDLLTFPPFGQ